VVRKSRTSKGEIAVKECWINVYEDGMFGNPLARREDAIDAADELFNIFGQAPVYRIHVRPDKMSYTDIENKGKIIAAIEKIDIRWNTSKIDNNVFEASINFDAAKALAVLLAHEVVFVNNNWWRKSWSEEDQKSIAVCVNCNDVFAWACSDAERLPYDEIESLYIHWELDPEWGPAIWCMKRRNQMPQKPVEDIIRKIGKWDFDFLQIGANTQDG